jgi:hypothetical protein
MTKPVSNDARLLIALGPGVGYISAQLMPSLLALLVAVVAGGIAWRVTGRMLDTKR